MPTLDHIFLTTFGLGGFLLGVVLTLLILRAVRSRRSRRRTVERPNSHYSSQLARDRVTRHRWHDIALERVHEINREEVVRLLARVDATSVQALSEKERAFLDYMVEVAGRSAPSTKRPRHPLEPQLGIG